MAILIPDMQMPKCCVDCQCIIGSSSYCTVMQKLIVFNGYGVEWDNDGDGYSYCIADKNQRTKHCPLISVAQDGDRDWLWTKTYPVEIEVRKDGSVKFCG